MILFASERVSNIHLNIICVQVILRDRVEIANLHSTPRLVCIYMQRVVGLSFSFKRNDNNIIIIICRSVYRRHRRRFVYIYIYIVIILIGFFLFFFFTFQPWRRSHRYTVRTNIGEPTKRPQQFLEPHQRTVAKVSVKKKKKNNF